MEITTLRTILWNQYGAAIEMLEYTLTACPPERWTDSLWHDDEDPRYSEFWFVIYHTLFWIDLYLGGVRQGFKPPEPFISGALPTQPYTREQLQAYLDQCRSKARATFENLTEEGAARVCKFDWIGDITYAELQMYCMRHIQEHAAQLGLHLGSGPDWVSRAGQK